MEVKKKFTERITHLFCKPQPTSSASRSSTEEEEVSMGTMVPFINSLLVAMVVRMQMLAKTSTKLFEMMTRTIQGIVQLTWAYYPMHVDQNLFFRSYLILQPCPIVNFDILSLLFQSSFF